MKNATLSFLFLILLMSSCSETPFVPNASNELLVGDWTISEVDNADALVSGTELMNSFMNEKFLPNHVFTFEKGANFQLKNTNGEQVFSGFYAIGENNKSLRLKIEEVVYNYDLMSSADDQFHVNSSTAGETVNLVINKK